MSNPTYEKLLDAGVHFGHLSCKWNPKMRPFIFMERNNIHIIDLNKTLQMLQGACEAVRQLARSGKKILFVGTKKQSKEIVEKEAIRCDMPRVTERWLGGTLTNFSTIRRSMKKLSSLDKQRTDGTYESLNKRERQRFVRERDKMAKVLEGILDLYRLPAALFVIDIRHEHIAVAEAKKLNIPIIAIVDTNSNPDEVDYPIPANDDAASSIQVITETISEAILEGLSERRGQKDVQKSPEENVPADAVLSNKSES